ncbi:MAG TPA: cupredoxin domain-containing protein [Terracidiphilus sp.]|nr:cupredoxin domain-containing protein [Terracidiphilus sp.]
MKKVVTIFVLASSLILPSAVLSAKNAADASVKRVEITAKRYEFDPGEITLKKGEPVDLVLKSADVPHGVRIRELGLQLKAPKGGTSEVRFTPEKVGTFTGRCYVFCGEGHGKMTITLHVVD